MQLHGGVCFRYLWYYGGPGVKELPWFHMGNIQQIGEYITIWSQLVNASAATMLKIIQELSAGLDFALVLCGM